MFNVFYRNKVQLKLIIKKHKSFDCIFKDNIDSYIIFYCMTFADKAN